MATVQWPTSIRVAAGDYSIQFDVQINTTRNGRIETYGLSGARWVATLTFPNQSEQTGRPAVEALIVSLEGGANRLQMPHFGRPIPNGTLRGSPVLSGAVIAGAKQLILRNVTNGQTLLRGDIIGLPNQLLMVTADTVASGGTIAVQTRPALFSGYVDGTSVTWNSPTTLWIPQNSTAGPFPFQTGKYRPGFSVDFVEAPA